MICKFIYRKNLIMISRDCHDQTRIRKGLVLRSTISYNNQGTFWRASSYPDFTQNYFLIKRMFDFSDNRDKCRKPRFFRGNIYTSCISMVLLDHFANKSNTFRHSLSLSLSLSPISSHFLLGSPLPPIPDPRIAQLMVPCLITSLVYKCH